MAINKRKVLDAARKHIQRGAKQKALKEFERLLKLDPRDGRLRLEIGDAHRRWGQIEEAISQYTKVADQYQQEGFDARAVAVLKQILNLDPKRYASYVALSELYQRMGLDAEAVSSLQTAADGYHKEGKKREALELLRKMASLDPGNTTSRLKVADLLKQEGLESEAISEYEAVAEELQSQGSHEMIATVYMRILEIEPERVSILTARAQNLLRQGQAGRAEPFALKALDKDGDDVEHYELVCDIYKALDRPEDLADVTLRLAKLYRDRGDDDGAREIMQRLPAVESLEVSGDLSEQELPPELELDQTESSSLDDEDLLEDEFLATDGEIGLGRPADALVAEESAPEPEPEEADLPEGDSDQLFAEASVYLRYGKRDQAIASLRAILKREPEHRASLEKLGEAYAEGGQDEQAVEMWTRAAECARSAGDADAFGILRDRVSALDSAAAADIEPMDDGTSVDGDADESEVAIDDSSEESVETLAADSGDNDREEPLEFVDEIEAAEAAEPPDVGEIEIDIDGGEIDADLDAQPEDSEPLLDESAPVLESIDIDVDIDVDGEGADENDGPTTAFVAEEPSTAVSIGADQSASSVQRVTEDLEEAEFYFKQGLYDEAEAIYQRVLEAAPRHPSAMLRLGEIAAQRGADPTDAGAAPGAFSTPTLEHVDESEAEESEAEPESEPESEPEAAVAEAEITARSDETQPSADEDVEAVAESEPEDAEDECFDLAAELRDAFDDDEEDERDPNETSGVLSTVEDGFASIFSEFKKGVSATLSEGDHETRYDLGIAYKEMGLYEDAIAEFRVCLGSPDRLVDSLSMMGLCALDLDRPGDAVSHLEQALATDGLRDETRAGLSFDLGRSLQALGDTDRARSAFATVVEIEPDFPGVAAAIASLDQAPAETVDAVELSDDPDGFESFEELMEEAPEEAETFESFDDVITEAEAEAVEPEGEAPPAAKSDGARDRKPPRKKKISFV
ncbi:MAG: tetratricopeptide repeat protein [Proteobacteria bacterium]|nr:tetratricopeptide repeat protein [Pseudomonadota bacterium]